MIPFTSFLFGKSFGSADSQPVWSSKRARGLFLAPDKKNYFCLN